MNLLFILGNGFDLQLGLPTSYQDFYKYYISRPSNSPLIKQLKRDISNDLQNWSDLELSLGIITEKYPNAESFCEIYDDIQSELQKYLLKVEELTQSGILTVNSNLDVLKYGLCYPEKYFNKEGQESIEYYISHSINPLVNVNVLTFNYTHTLEYFLTEKIMSGAISLGTRTFFTKIRHIHRDLSPRDSIWLGVDNVSQILNQSFTTDDTVRFRLIKPEILMENSAPVFADINSTIQNADYICIFGVSLGDTDNTWVKKIGEKIAKGTLTMLFVKDNKTFKSDNDKLVFQRRYRNSFIDKMEKLGIIFNKQDLKIFVEINSPIFAAETFNPHNQNLNILLEQLK